MFDFDIDIDSTNKMRKIKGNSISSKSELKKIAKMKFRNDMCFDAIGKFPENNEVKSFVSKGMSDAGSFLNAFNEEFGVIDEATICTWTISMSNIKRILNFIDNGLIKKCVFLLNDGLLKTNSTKSIYAFLRLEFDKRKEVSYAVANTHAKIQMYKSGDRYVTISGSGNWSENPRIENYIIIGGKETYDFNVGWVKSIIKHGV